MNKHSFRPLAWGLAAVLFLSGSARVLAGPVDLLRDAYSQLAEADHDYKGHRAEAMKSLEAAGKTLGVKFHGDDKQHEKQGISDEHLRTAQNLIQQAKAGLSRRTLRHLNAAEKEINIALSVK